MSAAITGIRERMESVRRAFEEVKAEMGLRPDLRVWSLFDLLERLDEDLP